MAAALALAAFVLHAATTWRYGYFRDELYFIACAKHLSWGYVDQPPLVAFAAFLSAPAHYHLTLLRLLPSLAAAGTVWLAVRLTRELGGGRLAQAVAGIAVMLLPAYLLLGNTLTTTSFEPLFWTLLLYAAVRMVRSGDPRWWAAIAAAFVFGMYGKYSMLLCAAAVAAGLLATHHRRLLFSRWSAAALALSALALWPNIAWQWAHGWPFVQVVQGDFAHRHAFQNGMELEYRNTMLNGAAFALEQIVYSNPLAAVVWAAGLIAFAAWPPLRDLRFVTIAYFIAVAAAVVLAAKGYYVIGFYAVPIAGGAVYFERALQGTRLRAAAAAVAAASALIFLPLALPVLPVDGLVEYSRALGLTGRNGSAPRLIQPLFAEEFGWRELTARVAGVYDALPPRVRARTAIFADTYGDAGALAFYGPQYGLPDPISAQNTFYLWGPRAYNGRSLLMVGASQADLVHSLYRKMTLVATYADPYKWVVEGPTPIYLCSDPIAPLPQLWPRLKWYGA
ncbi:MAG TPA: glycosyltransferase family 39 protein [Candidatus Baltobacteraceae bacterium]|nr:glycosyltransferase family 39 protein [Candidatus Baltobacteraceae bacterium]